ncbi:hypothetical protein OG511_41880 [Streptomyces sp. NBC_01453]|uniref:hypothetical protein n=1 Tax=Streptomyces sp. NBC_01453 TaxID=2903873 RepID=UPI002E2E4A52|nr:hypothetical protein [Streptomyces sp. NBC_01453]
MRGEPLGEELDDVAWDIERGNVDDQREASGCGQRLVVRTVLSGLHSRPKQASQLPIHGGDVSQSHRAQRSFRRKSLTELLGSIVAFLRNGPRLVLPVAVKFDRVMGGEDFDLIAMVFGQFAQPGLVAVAGGAIDLDQGLEEGQSWRGAGREWIDLAMGEVGVPGVQQPAGAGCAFRSLVTAHRHTGVAAGVPR